MNNLDKFKEFLRSKGMPESQVATIDNVLCTIANLLSRKRREYVGPKDRVISKVIRHEDNIK